MKLAESKIKHEGLNQHRLASNPREKVFADLWKERNETGSTLGYLLDGQDRRLHDVIPSEAEAAATVIQWLGSPVGQFFLQEAENRIVELGL